MLSYSLTLEQACTGLLLSSNENCASVSVYVMVLLVAQNQNMKQRHTTTFERGHAANSLSFIVAFVRLHVVGT